MDLLSFILKAKLRTYTTGGEGAEITLPDGVHEFNFREGSFFYRDHYVGFNPFTGQELIWQDGIPVWSMNYYGLVVGEQAPAAEVYRFLQKAMRHVGPERPYRGPHYYWEGDFEYFDKSEGGLERFKGVERIFYKKEEVYRLEYQGGAIR